MLGDPRGDPDTFVTEVYPARRGFLQAYNLHRPEQERALRAEQAGAEAEKERQDEMDEGKGKLTNYIVHLTGNEVATVIAEDFLIHGGWVTFFRSVKDKLGRPPVAAFPAAKVEKILAL